MSDYIRVSGKNVEDALLEASIQLQTSSDNIEYNVIEKETKGFLGIGAKKAVIEARARRTDEDIVKEVFSSKKTGKKPESAVKKQENTRDTSGSGQPAKDKSETKKAEKSVSEKAAEMISVQTEKSAEKTAEKTSDKNNENRKNIRRQPSGKPVPPSDSNRVKDVPAKKSTEAASRRETEPKSKAQADPEEVKKSAEQFLTDLFSAMGADVKITEEFAEDVLSINLEGDDMGMLIGKRGQTLDSIQFLTSLVVNKGKSSYVRVKVDTENYRDRRKQTLENLARNIAIKVKKTGKPVYLEPMNPYERRVIHFALQNDPYVSTHSEGEDPCRKVVVTPKKRTEE